ncbi:putative ribonuclease H-like domain-containing protein, partial [Tanacetum coccineum]
LENVADKEGQHQMIEDEQVLHDELEKMIDQEVVAKALDDATRQAFEEEKRNIASQKRATQANKLSIGRLSVSTATTPYVSAASTPTGANAGESSFVYLGGKISIDASTLPNVDLPIDLNMPDLEDDSDAFSNDGIFNGAYNDENVGAVDNFNNMDDTINVSPIPTLRIHKDYLKDQILGDPKSAVQTRGKIQKASLAQQALNISQALQDESWVEAMQEELLQFKLQKVWILVDLPSRKKAIGTKWVFKNKRDEISIVVNNKVRLVAQGFRQEEGIDYDEVFAPVAKIEAIRLFLDFASYMGFTVYQMDVKSAFFYGTIEEEVYVYQPPSFVDHAHPKKIYNVIKALYGLHQAPRAWYETLSSFLMENGFRRDTIDKTFFIKKNKSNILMGILNFHEIIDFLTRSSIHYALTVSPVVSTTFVEQFWMTAKSKTINNVRYITATVAGKPVSISEASIRSDLQFNDAAGIDVLPNQAIFDTIQLMGYEGDLNTLTFNKGLFSPQWKFLFHTIIHCLSSKSTSWDQIPTNIATVVICLATHQVYNFSKLIFDGMMRHLDAKKKFIMYPRFIPVFLTNQLKNVPVPLDHFPVNALTTKVFSFMVKKGNKNSGNVTPLFPSMLAQPTEDEDLLLLTQFLIPFQKALVGIIEVTTQAAQIKILKAQILQAKRRLNLLSHIHMLGSRVSLLEEKIGR